jgi:hypothetical protein
MALHSPFIILLLSHLYDIYTHGEKHTHVTTQGVHTRAPAGHQPPSSSCYPLAVDMHVMLLTCIFTLPPTYVPSMGIASSCCYTHKHTHTHTQKERDKRHPQTSPTRQGTPTHSPTPPPPTSLPHIHILSHTHTHPYLADEGLPILANAAVSSPSACLRKMLAMMCCCVCMCMCVCV